MKALVFNGPGDIRYESFDDPKLLTDNGVIIKVNKCSICGSDLHILHGASLSRHVEGPPPRFCVGHEFLGEIVETGQHVHQFTVGDRAIASAGTGCGNCAACKVGRWLDCRRQTAFGIGPHLHGGQAEYVFVPNADTTLLNINDGISDEAAMLLTDALPTAYFGMSRAGLKHGAIAAIIGLGPIGILGVELAFLMGASEVFAIDPVPERRACAETLGARAFAPGQDTVKQIRALTQGRGASSVFEASGATAAIESTLSYAAPGGTISMIGVPTQSVNLPVDKILGRNLTVRAGIAPVPELWPSVVPLLKSGRLKGHNIFTHNFNLKDGAKAYDAFNKRDDGIIKVMMSVG